MRKRSLFIIFLVIISAAFLSWKTKYETATSEKGKVVIPVKKVNDGVPHYYKLALDGKEIRFFLLMSNDGVIRAAFDACDVCYPFKKGYSYEGDFVICNNCGRRFHESKINVVQGGCNPAPIERSFDRENVYISLDALGGGAVYF